MIRLEVSESIDGHVVELLRRHGVAESEPDAVEATAGLARDEYEEYGGTDFLSLHLIDETAQPDEDSLVAAMLAVGALARERELTARLTLPNGLELRLEDEDPARLRRLIGRAS